MGNLLTLSLVSCCMTALGFVAPQKVGPPPIFQSMPDGWTVQKSIEVNGQQRTAIGGRLGAKIDRLANTVVGFNGQPLQINTLVCATDDDAKRLEGTLRKGKPLRQLVQRNGRTVYELVTRRKSDVKLALAARYALGIQPKEVKYKVTFKAVPLQTCDCMKWNEMFNLFLQSEANPSTDLDRQIMAMAKDFTFGKEIVLSAYGVGKAKTRHALSPKPAGEKMVGGGHLRRFAMKNLNNQSGIGTVAVELLVTSQTGVATPHATQLKGSPLLTSATQRWPVSDPDIKSLAKKIVGSANTPREKVQAILLWLSDQSNVRFAGDVTGSRYGVKKFLQQKFGHCWDYSDAFVTLSRATGVPTRQVFGWLHGSSGHVWAQCLIPEEGWKHVDPTAATGCGSDYIPITASEDGEVPLLYTSAVNIQVVGTSADR